MQHRLELWDMHEASLRAAYEDITLRIDAGKCTGGGRGVGVRRMPWKGRGVEARASMCGSAVGEGRGC